LGLTSLSGLVALVPKRIINIWNYGELHLSISIRNRGNKGLRYSVPRYKALRCWLKEIMPFDISNLTLSKSNCDSKDITVWARDPKVYPYYIGHMIQRLLLIFWLFKPRYMSLVCVRIKLKILCSSDFIDINCGLTNFMLTYFKMCILRYLS
jgi:hypothetical protein